jgi:TRAP-type C4-dicarboxylate transport system permease small subunit
VSALVYRLCRYTAWFSGAVVAAIALVSVVSIAGRALSGLGLGPVPGDFELVEAGTALAVFSALPWCYLARGHAAVDIFWEAFPQRLKSVVQVATSALMLLVWALLTWRMGIAMFEHRASGETTFILGMPLWWGYAAAMPPAVIGCVAYAWRMLEDIGLASPPPGFAGEGAAH